MQSQFTALFDSCVLYPAPLRDLLIKLAYTGLFRAKWTEQIHIEWMESLISNRDDLTRAKLERTKNLMNNRVLDCLVQNYEPLIETLTLPDPNDRHVLAAAIWGQAQVIVTYNINDFSKSILSQYNIEAQHPDQFLSHQISFKPNLVLSSVKEIRSRLKNPHLSVEEYLSILMSQHLPQTVSFLKQYSELI